MMKSKFEIFGVTKPSQVVQAMIDGLWEADSREDFEINMDFYGNSSNGICFGCAATCALQKLANKKFNQFNIVDRGLRAAALNIGRSDLGDLEAIIEYLRNGIPSHLLWTFGLSEKVQWEFFNRYYPNHRLPALFDFDWKENISEYQDFADKLKQEGL